jgi:hypothetical protein
VELQGKKSFNCVCDWFGLWKIDDVSLEYFILLTGYRSFIRAIYIFPYNCVATALAVVILYLYLSYTK